MRNKPAGQIKDETGASYSALTILTRDYGLKREKRRGIFVYDAREVRAKMAERKADARKKRRVTEAAKAKERAARYEPAERNAPMVQNWGGCGGQDAVNVNVERRGRKPSTNMGGVPVGGWVPKAGGYFAQSQSRSDAKHAAESEARRLEGEKARAAQRMAMELDNSEW